MWTIEQYNTLKEAIASGTKTVKYSDKEVTYRSLEEMMTLLRAIERELGLNKTKMFVDYPTHSKGLE